MSVNILHHGRCFDGAASAALFAAFCRQKLGVQGDLRFIPKHHQQGDPFVEDDFACDWAACVDFRYSQHPKLRWYFDHHRSAFQLPGDAEHFAADQSGLKFHDPAAISCASYLAGIAAERFGFDFSPHSELIEWADIIDSARFSDPEAAIAMDRPALQLAAYIQSEDDEGQITQFIEDLQGSRLGVLSQADYVQSVVRPRIAQHHDDIEAVAKASHRRGRIVAYDLLDHDPRLLSHFIPYYHYPDADYAVGVYRHIDGDLRITVGYNPWLPPSERDHDLASLCERFGGGGHPFVAGCSFGKDDLEPTRRAYGAILNTLDCEAKSNFAPGRE